MSDIDIMLKGDPIEAMEAAKRVIGRDDVDIASLSGIAAKQTNPKWSRIAAIYSLGFTDDDSASVGTLLHILADRHEDEQCRAYAAEALGSMQGAQVVPIVGQVLLTDESPEVKKWCIYALSQIGGSKARGILSRLARSNPTGIVKDELDTVFKTH